VTCYRAAATCRTGSHTGSITTGTTATAAAATQEVAVAVVSAPQTGLPAKTKEALLRCYYAHRYCHAFSSVLEFVVSSQSAHKMLQRQLNIAVEILNAVQYML
jgi:hypothetical protein